MEIRSIFLTNPRFSIKIRKQPLSYPSENVIFSQQYSVYQLMLFSYFHLFPSTFHSSPSDSNQKHIRSFLCLFDRQKLFHGCIKDSTEFAAQRNRYVGILIAQISDVEAVVQIRNSIPFKIICICFYLESQFPSASQL